MKSTMKELAQHFDREYILPLQAYADHVYQRPTYEKLIDLEKEMQKLKYLMRLYIQQVNAMAPLLTQAQIEEIQGLIQVQIKVVQYMEDEMNWMNKYNHREKLFSENRK